jgi:hypothetical protein
MLTRRALTLTSLVAIGASCTFLNPLDGYVGGATDAGPQTTDALTPPPVSSDAESDASDASSSCNPASPPERPPPSTAPQPTDRLLFAASTLELGSGKQGYDLDGVCTCPGAGSCTPLGTRAMATCDGPGGIDDALGPLLSSIVTLFPKDGAISTSGSDFIRSGRQTVFVQLRGYDGTPNDDEVQVALLSGSGFVPPSDAGTPDGGAALPKLDGTDTWTIEPDSVIGQSGPPYIPRVEDPRGYVRNGVLVANLDLDLRVGLFRTVAKESRLTARIEKVGGAFRLREGMISARARSGDLLTGLESVRSPLPTSNAYLCRGDLVYLEAKRRLCEALDLAATRGDDNRGKPCGAISLTLTFEAVPAKAGALFARPIERPCGDDWFDDCSK